MAVRVPKYARLVYALNANLTAIAAQTHPASQVPVYSQLQYVLPEINRVTEIMSKHVIRMGKDIHHLPAAEHVQEREYVRKLLNRSARQMHCDAMVKLSNHAMYRANGNLKQFAP